MSGGTVKLKIAVDDTGNYVAATVLDGDTDEPMFNIGTILTSMAAEQKSLFEDWKTVMIGCLQAMLTNATGVTTTIKELDNGQKVLAVEPPTQEPDVTQ